MENKMTSLFKKEIHDFYNNIDEDARLKRSKANSIEFLTTTKYMNNLIKPESIILDACAGTGIYALYLANRNHKVVAGDLVESNVKKMKDQIKTSEQKIETYVGSILDLSKFEDESFDAVLNLGSLYHLKNEVDRKRCVEECLRVLKPNGLLFTAYINKYANLLKYKEGIKDNFDSIEFYLKHGYNDENDLFFATTPNEIQSFLAEFNTIKLHNMATDGPKFILKETINSFSDDEFQRWMNIHYKMCETDNLLGYSEHGLLISRKL